MTGEATAVLAAAAPRGADAAERLGVLFDTHHGRLYRLARRLSRNADDARDLIQDTFVRAARNVAKVPSGATNEEAWLVRVMINLSHDRWRQTCTRARHDAFVTGLHSLPPADPESVLIARSIVGDALNALSPRRRAVVVMHELEGAGIPAIALALGVTQVTVRWHLSRGRHEMAASIRERAGDQGSGTRDHGSGIRNRGERK